MSYTETYFQVVLEKLRERVRETNPRACAGCRHWQPLWLKGVEPTTIGSKVVPHEDVVLGECRINPPVTSLLVTRIGEPARRFPVTEEHDFCNGFEPHWGSV